MKQISSKNIIIIYFFLYSSLLFGFYLNEDFALGFIRDYELHLKLIHIFDNSILDGFMNYEDEKVPHSPIYVFYFSFFENIFKNEVITRLFHLHICLLIPFFLYKSLEVKFKKKIGLYLYLIPVLIFVSPYFRSGLIWIDDNLLALVFLSISIFYFIKYDNEKDNLLINILLNTFFLALAAYIRPIYSLFGLYFFIRYTIEIKSIKILFFYIILNFILCWPAVYYVFILGIDDWFQGYLFRRNIISVVSLSQSVLFFYLLPYLLFYFKDKFIKKFNAYDVLIFFIYLILLNIFFVYDVAYSGGIFFKISNYVFNNLIFFFLIASLSFVLIFKFFWDPRHKINSYYDFLLLIILLMFELDGVIYHETYDPLFYLLIFTIFKNSFLNNFIFSMNNNKYFSLVILSFSFYIMSVLKTLI